ncbi:DUF6300 family protein [Streptomyces pacificus]|uniref:DUF6300 family protein n=1 Tax=Streptomyces pacificus TaxID=2705029 RepID=UPI001564A0E1|nr:DUF6300 family protein [Streptomyces pacificus]
MQRVPDDGDGVAVQAEGHGALDGASGPAACLADPEHLTRTVRRSNDLPACSRCNGQLILAAQKPQLDASGNSIALELCASIGQHLR